MNPSGAAATKNSPSVVRTWTVPPWSRPSSGAWPGRIPTSPSVVRAITIEAWPCHTVRSAATSATSRCEAGWSAISVFLLQLGPLAVDVLERTDVEERLLGNVVVLALGDLLEGLDGFLQRHGGARDVGELLRHVGVLGEELLDPARPRDGDLVLFRERVHTEDGDDVLQFLVLLQDLLHPDGHVVVLLADVLRVEDTRRGGQRVDGRVQTPRRYVAPQLGGSVQGREGGGRRRVGVVVGGYVDRLHRGDRVTARRGDPLLQNAHLVGQVGLVTHRGRHPAQQGRHLRTGLGEPEDVVDEQQHVLLLHVAEVLRHRQGRQRDTQSRARRLVHLTEDQRGVLEDAGLLHLVDQVVALTGALTDAGEHRGAAEVVGDP